MHWAVTTASCDHSIPILYGVTLEEVRLSSRSHANAWSLGWIPVVFKHSDRCQKHCCRWYQPKLRDVVCIEV